MPSSSKGAELTLILDELNRADIKYILVDALAAVIQGAPVTTVDVDIVYERSPENIARIIAFLESVDAFYRRPDDKIVRPKEDDFILMGHRLFATRLGALDVLAYIEDEKKYEDLISHTVKIDFRKHKLHVLALKTLIELKRNSRDPKDQQRLPVFEETLHQLEKNE